MVLEWHTKKQCSSAGFTQGMITWSKPCEDAEGSQGNRGRTGIGTRGVVYTYVKSSMRPDNKSDSKKKVK